MGELTRSIIAQATCNLAQARRHLPARSDEDAPLISFSPVQKQTGTLTTLSIVLSSDSLHLLSQFASDVLTALQNGELVYAPEVSDVLDKVFNSIDELLKQLQEPGFDEQIFLAGAEVLCEQSEERLEPAREKARELIAASGPGALRPSTPLPDYIADWLSACGTDLLCETLFTVIAVDKPLKVVVYRPDPDCFFRGEDAYAIAAACPGAIAQRVLAKPHMEGPDDVFLCHMDIIILSVADENELAGYTAQVHEQAETVSVSVYQLFPYCSDIIRDALRTDEAELLNDMMALQDAEQVACISGFLYSSCEHDSAIAAVYAGIEKMALEPTSLERFQHLLSFNPAPMDADAYTLIELDTIDGEPVEATSLSQAETGRATIQALLEQQKLLIELMIAGEQDSAALAAVQAALARRLSNLLNPSDDTEEIQ